MGDRGLHAPSARLAGVLLVGALAACSSYPSVEGSPLARPASKLDSTQTSSDAEAPGAPAPPQDADASSPAPTGAPDASGPKQLRAFVASQTRTGNLGGLAGADAFCEQLATAAGIGGTYRAWLSAGATSPLDRLTSNGPWYLVTGAMVVATKSQLATGVLTTSLDKDEKGATPPIEDDQAWTATDPSGKPYGDDCSAWTTTSGSAVVGEAEHADSRWTARTKVDCSSLKRVYCFEL